MFKIRKSRIVIILILISLTIISVSFNTVYCYFTCGENILGKTNNSGKEISKLTISYYNSIIVGDVTITFKGFTSAPTIILLDKDGSRIVNTSGDDVKFSGSKSTNDNYKVTFNNSTYEAAFIQLVDKEISKTIDSKEITITNN